MALSDISVEQVGPAVAVVRLSGEHDLNTMPELRSRMEECERSGSSIVLDLSAATFIDSSILAALVDAHRRAGDGDRTFALVVGPDSGDGVQRVLEVTGLGEQLEIHRQLTEALAAAGDGQA